MFLDRLIENPWLSIGCWVILYCLDYGLTLWGARMYQTSAGKHFSFSEGYELNEFFKDDIATLRPVSFRFLLTLFFTSGLLLIGFSIRMAGLFEFTWGMLVGLQLSVLFRHVLNLTMFYYSSKSAGVSGSVRFDHWLSLRLAAVESLYFSLFFFAIYLLAEKIFLLGGSAGCLLLALRHLGDSHKSRKSPVPSK